MIHAKYSRRPGGGAEPLPRVVQVGIEPGGRIPGTPRSARPFSVTFHEEATGLRYRRQVAVRADVERRMVELVGLLHRWSLGPDTGPTEAEAMAGSSELGRLLDATFLGDEGDALLRATEPTAILLDVDESIVGLPWELLQASDGRFAIDIPFGRIVTTGILPTARRDPTDEDPVIRILAVVNPSDDLDATSAELEALRSLQRDGGEMDGDVVQPIVLTVLADADATVAGLAEAVRGQAFDILHFAGHGHYVEGSAHASSVSLADGPLTADHVAGLAWAAPPYVVFNSSCESARIGLGRGLLADGHYNALPAAFLAAGAEAYLGHFWPVRDSSAATFASILYDELFRLVNVGAAVLAARRTLRPRFETATDLTAFGSVFFGDAGSGERRDTAVSNGGHGDGDAGPDDQPDDRGPGGGRRDLARAA